MFLKHRLNVLVLLLVGCALGAITVAACTDNTVDMPQGPHGSVTADAATDAQNTEAGADSSSDTGADAVVDSAHDAPSDAGDAGDG